MPTMPEVTLPQGTVHYRDSGPRDAEVLLFVHGLLVDGSLWDGVVERLDDRRRCIVPDLPLGAHPTPMRPDADLSPRGIADLSSTRSARPSGSIASRSSPTTPAARSRRSR
jgi:pimeloyl-ACP methyl ester carboxylesterase